MIRRLIGIVLGLLLPIGAEGAIALVTKGSGNQSANTHTITDTFGSSTAGATLLVVNVAASAGVDTCTVTLSDTVGGSATGNIWAHGTAQKVASYNGTCLWYSYSSGSGSLVTGATHVVTASGFGGSTSGSIFAYAFSGSLTSSSPFDQENGASSSSATSLSTGSITPTQCNALVFSASTERSQSHPTYGSSPLTVADAMSWVSGQYTGIAQAYTIQTDAAAVSNTWTMNGAGQIAVSITSFKAATGCSASSRFRRVVVAQ